MEIRLKERLVGALVIVAIAVVVLPWIFDDEKSQADFSSQIPDAPPLPPSRVVELAQPRPLDEQGFDDSAIAAKTQAGNAETADDMTDTGSESLPAEQPAPAQSSPEQAIAEQTPASTESKTADNGAKPKTVTTTAAISGGFVVQLGSFGNKANAGRLVSDLKAKGLAAYMRDDKTVKPAVYRVLVGPTLEREQAEQMQAKAKSLSGLNPIVVTYDPLKH